MLFPWLALIGTLASVFGGAFSKKASPKKELPTENEPKSEIEETIRREIQRKKEARKTEEANRLEQEEARVNKPEIIQQEPIETVSPFQVRMEEQALQIKQKQEEAERLKSNLERFRSKQSVGLSSSEGDRSAFSSSHSINQKVRLLLGNKSDIKVTLLAGELLAPPLALRETTNYKG